MVSQGLVLRLSCRGLVQFSAKMGLGSGGTRWLGGNALASDSQVHGIESFLNGAPFSPPFIFQIFMPDL